MNCCSMNDCKDYYKVLGVSKDVSDLDLKKQYRKVCMLAVIRGRPHMLDSDYLFCCL